MGTPVSSRSEEIRSPQNSRLYRKFISLIAEHPILFELLGITTLGLVIRLVFLWQIPLLYDESYTFTHYISEPFFYGLSTYNAPNNHLFHTALGYLNTNLFGSSLWSLRLSAFLAGVALLPLVYWMTLKNSGRSVARITALLLAVCTPLLFYSANARGYSLQIFFWWQLIYLTCQSTRASYWQIGLVAFFMLYTVPSSAIYLFVLFGSLLIINIKRSDKNGLVKTGTAAITAITLSGLAYLPPLLNNGLATFKRESAQWSTIPLLEQLNRIGNLLYHTLMHQMGGVSLGMLIFFALGALITVRKKRAKNIFVIFMLTGVFIAITRVVPPYPRLYLPLIPFLFWFAAIGLDKLMTRPGRIGRSLGQSSLLVLLLTLSISSFQFLSMKKNQTVNTKQVSHFLAKSIAPGDYLVSATEYLEKIEALALFNDQKDGLRLDYRRSQNRDTFKRKLEKLNLPLKWKSFLEQLANRFLYSARLYSLRPTTFESIHLEWHQSVLQRPSQASKPRINSIWLIVDSPRSRSKLEDWWTRQNNQSLPDPLSHQSGQVLQFRGVQIRY